MESVGNCICLNNNQTNKILLKKTQYSQNTVFSINRKLNTCIPLSYSLKPFKRQQLSFITNQWWTSTDIQLVSRSRFWSFCSFSIFKERRAIRIKWVPTDTYQHQTNRVKRRCIYRCLCNEGTTMLCAE